MMYLISMTWDTIYHDADREPLFITMSAKKKDLIMHRLSNSKDLTNDLEDKRFFWLPREVKDKIKLIASYGDNKNFAFYVEEVPEL